MIGWATGWFNSWGEKATHGMTLAELACDSDPIQTRGTRPAARLLAGAEDSNSMIAEFGCDSCFGLAERSA